jgi:hypothetical protein
MIDPQRAEPPVTRASMLDEKFRGVSLLAFSKVREL